MPNSHEEKLSENQARLDLSLLGIKRLKNEDKDLNKPVQICDEKEHEYKEEIDSLKPLICEKSTLCNMEEVAGENVTTRGSEKRS